MMTSQPLPSEGAIEAGRVVRIEPYGAFVALSNYPRLSGLVHISQLSSEKVQDVTDVVQVDDEVQVLVLEVTLPDEAAAASKDPAMDAFVNSHNTNNSNNNRQRPPRPKIRLRLQSGGRTPTATNDAASAHITRSLNSSIGMGVALDPMAAHHSNKNRLILKNDPQQQQQQLINGYALVDDFEGELPQPDIVAAAEQPATAPAKPMGRGRGTTLPAWMTRAQETGDGITKKSNNDNGEDDHSSRSRSSSASSYSSRRGRKRKHKKRSHKKHSKRKHKHHSKHKKERKHSTRRRYDSDDDSDRSEGRDEERKSKKRHKRRSTSPDDRRRSPSAESEGRDEERKSKKRHKRRSSPDDRRRSPSAESDSRQRR